MGVWRWHLVAKLIRLLLPQRLDGLEACVVGHRLVLRDFGRFELQSREAFGDLGVARVWVPHGDEPRLAEAAIVGHSIGRLAMRSL